MPSLFKETLEDYFDGVTGLLRKRARYRCEKRGEDYEKYLHQVREAQRKINERQTIHEYMKQTYSKEPSWFSKIDMDEAWGGAYLIVPFTASKRKRSRHRKNISFAKRPQVPL